MLACSHVTLASNDVPRMMRFIGELFGLTPRFENEEFGEFVLPSGFRLAVFKVVGRTRDFFTADGERGTLALGVTVVDVDEIHRRVEARREESGARTSGPPKDHPWGERSFLLIDPDGNRWEVTQSPTGGGMLTDCGVDVAP